MVQVPWVFARSTKQKRTTLLVVALVVALGLIAWSTTWFDEDFENGSGGWFIGFDSAGGGNWQVVNGRYQVLMARDASLSQSLSPRAEVIIEPPYSVETVVRIQQGTPGEAGLVYRCNTVEGVEECRTFSVLADGSYRLGRILRGRLETLPITTAPHRLYTSRDNTLRIEALGDTICFYGNGRLLATVTEEGVHPAGEVGLFARTETEAFFVARFDSITLEP